VCGQPCSPFLPNSCKLGLVCLPATGDVGHCGAAPVQPSDKDAGGAQPGGDASTGTLDAGVVDAGSVAVDGNGAGGVDAGGVTTPPTSPGGGGGGPFDCSSHPGGSTPWQAWPLLLALVVLIRRRSIA